VEKAVVRLSHVPEIPPASGVNTSTDQPEIPNDSQVLTFDDFKDASCGCGEIDCSCSDTDQSPDTKEKPFDPCDPTNAPDINPGFLKQLIYVKKLQALTGVDLDKLLVFWDNISTQGIKPLYSKLFLIHNLLGIDTIFQGDSNGNFLARNERISDHILVILAAL
jgi:hypothetical protein